MDGTPQLGPIKTFPSVISSNLSWYLIDTVHKLGFLKMDCPLAVFEQIDSITTCPLVCLGNIWRQNLQCLHVEGDKNEGFGRNKTGAKENWRLKLLFSAPSVLRADAAEKIVNFLSPPFLSAQNPHSCRPLHVNIANLTLLLVPSAEPVCVCK